MAKRLDFYSKQVVPFVWEHGYKKASTATFHFVKLKLFLNYQKHLFVFKLITVLWVVILF